MLTRDYFKADLFWSEKLSRIFIFEIGNEFLLHVTSHLINNKVRACKVFDLLLV